MIEGLDFRALLGRWGTGVSVITAQSADGPAGGTVNAFTSLSLDPPLILVCFDLSSRTLHAVRESERFAVNILAATQQETSRLFATKRPQDEKFAETPHRLEHGAPVLDGSLAWLVCSLDSELRRGDHVIAIGQVLDGGYDEDADPLLYYRGGYLNAPTQKEA
jgi:3-hydroxy-9,10-secoandrosta-1,3,5(10)-triene-9,17-dione monooxygenase reductase component